MAIMAEREGQGTKRYDLTPTQEGMLYSQLYSVLMIHTSYEVNGMTTDRLQAEADAARSLFMAIGESLGRVDTLTSVEKVGLGLYGELELEELDVLEAREFNSPAEMEFGRKVQWARERVLELQVAETGAIAGREQAGTN